MREHSHFDNEFYFRLVLTALGFFIFLIIVIVLATIIKIKIILFKISLITFHPLRINSKVAKPLKCKP